MEMSRAKPEPKALPKRFYTAASVQQTGDDYGIVLDGKSVKTPQGKLLQTHSELLAQQIAAEWNAQGEFISADTMPLTRLLTIALDRVAEDRPALLEEIARYCDTDLLYYREPYAADHEAARVLAVLQQKHFTPILDWCGSAYGAVFCLTQGVMPIRQPTGTIELLRSIFTTSRDPELAALAMMIPLLGSALLALALWKGAIPLEEALIAARLDETVQAQYWGEDPETASHWEAKKRDISAAAFFLTCN